MPLLTIAVGWGLACAGPPTLYAVTVLLTAGWICYLLVQITKRKYLRRSRAATKTTQTTTKEQDQCP